MILFTVLCLVLSGVITYAVYLHTVVVKTYNDLDRREWLLFFSHEFPCRAEFVSECMANKIKVSYIISRFVFNFSLEKLLNNEWIEVYEYNEHSLNGIDNYKGKRFVLTDLGKKVRDAYVFQVSVLPLIKKIKPL